MNRRRAGIGAVVALAVLAACSGDDTAGDEPADGSSDPSPSATSAPSPASTASSDAPPDTSSPASATSAPSSAAPTDPIEEPPVTGSGDPSQCPVDALADGPTEITFWHAMSATNGVVLEELVAEYNSSQSQVRVTPVFQGGYQEAFSTYVNTVRSGGDLPTLVQLNETYLQPMVDSQSIVPIEHCIAASAYDLSDYSEVLLDQYRLDGTLMTMPFQLANLVLYYDGNDFVAAGLDPADPPATLDELIASSQALVDAGAVTAGLVLPVDAWPIEQWVTTAGELFVDQENGRAARAERTLLDSEVVRELLTTLQTMQTDGLMQVTGRGGEQAALAPYIAIAQGEAAMTIGSSATLGEIYEQIERVPDVDVRVGPFPGLGGRTSIGGGSIYLTNATDDAERAAAWDLLAWLNEPAQQVRWSAGTGYVPTRFSAADDPTLVALWDERPGFRVAWDQLAVSGEVPGSGGPVIGDYQGVRDAIEDGLEALYGGDEVESVQADVRERADQAISDYNERIGG